MRAATAHALDDGVERHVDLQHVVQFHASGLHRIGLRDGAREAVEQKTVGAIGLRDAFLDQVDDEIVTDQTTRLHHRFRLQTQGCARFHRGAQHVAGGNLRDAVFLANERGLRSFAGTRGAQQNQSHHYPSIRVSMAWPRVSRGGPWAWEPGRPGEDSTGTQRPDLHR